MAMSRSTHLRNTCLDIATRSTAFQDLPLVSSELTSSLRRYGKSEGDLEDLELDLPESEDFFEESRLDIERSQTTILTNPGTQHTCMCGVLILASLHYGREKGRGLEGGTLPDSCFRDYLVSSSSAVKANPSSSPSPSPASTPSSAAVFVVLPATSNLIRGCV